MGSSKETFKVRVKALEKRADTCLDAITARPSDLDFVHQQLRLYVQCRFVLDDVDMDSDNLAVLSERSIRKLMQVHDSKELQDLSAGCMGESSVSTKRTLFLLTLRRKLGITSGIDEFGAASTIAQLAEVVSHNLRDGQPQEPDVAQSQRRPFSS